mgnify:FL=1
MAWLDSDHSVCSLVTGWFFAPLYKALFQLETHSDLSQNLDCFQQVGADPCTNGYPFAWVKAKCVVFKQMFALF